MKIRIRIENEILGNRDFTTLDVKSINELTMDNCRNVVALNLAKKTFDTGERHKHGMWIAEPVKQSQPDLGFPPQPKSRAYDL